jgi:hypothetical protein
MKKGMFKKTTIITAMALIANSAFSQTWGVRPIDCPQLPKGFQNPTSWSNPERTNYLLTERCQPNTFVGINTQTPRVALDVNGSAMISGKTTFGSSINYSGSGNLQINSSNGANVTFGSLYNTVDVDVTGSALISGKVQFGSSNTNNLRVEDNFIDYSGRENLQINSISGVDVTFGSLNKKVDVDVNGSAMISGKAQFGFSNTNNLTVEDNFIDYSGIENLQINTNSGVDVTFGSWTKKVDVDVIGKVLAHKVGIGTDDPKELLQVGDGWSFHSGGTKFIGRNIHWDNGVNYYMGLAGAASKMSFNEHSIGFSFYTDSDVSDGAIATTHHQSLIIAADQSILVNYEGDDTPDATLSVKRTNNAKSYFLVEDENGGDKFKVASNGITYAKELKITADYNFPDYVFDKDYKLKSLTEVETFIKKNGHLPNIPSAAEVDENGVGVGELQIKLLEKVEELTLYLLEQQKEIDALKQQLKSK